MRNISIDLNKVHTHRNESQSETAQKEKIKHDIEEARFEITTFSISYFKTT